jgi:peptidoglycan-associated lipoprotein
MNKTLGLSLVIFFLFSVTSIAQNKYSKAADDAFTDQLYSLALTRYQKAYSKVKNNKGEKDRISLRMADCYRLMNNMKKAEIAYKRLALGKYAKDDPKVILYYADALKANGNYDDAITQYTAYREKVPGDTIKAKTGIETCTMAKEWMKNPSKYDIKWEKKINSKEDDFAPAYADKTQSSIFFTSTRPAATGKDIDNWTGMEFSDIFFARKDRKGDWNTPVPADLSEVLNTKANEGSAQFNSRYTILYFTRCWNELRRKNGCGIYRVNRSGTTTWGEPEKVELGGDSSSVYGQPSVTSDEGTIYFAAEIPGGKGGKDIWMATKKGAKSGKGKSREFGTPVNLGPVINTLGDEMFPFIRNDSVLYFASNGHKGMGGLDIFRSVRDSSGKWSPPENMKYPMNTFADDFAIVFNPEEPEEGYFSSNRPGGKGRDDIYSFVVPPLLFTLEGNITDDRTLQPLQGAKIRITGTNGRSVEDNSDDKGHYSFNKNQISPNTTYEIFVTKKDYFNEKGKETTVGLEKSKDLVRNFVLKPIPKKPVVLPDILYDLDKYDLKPQFRDSLQGLIATLDANETIVVELASHTDSRGSDERNDILSQRRAQSVVDYLISRGIDPDRMIAKGYGKRVPRTLTKDITKDGVTFTAGTVLTDSLINTLPNTQAKEAAHALNRRTEFSIVRNDYIPKSKPGKAVAPKIEVVENPEENIVPFSLTSDGLPEATCYVNGITETFRYDKKETSFFISAATALRLLKTGVIDKTDFEGDAEKIIGEGSIAEKAIFNIKEIRVGNKTVRNIQATVNSKIKTTILFGENTLSKFGSFTIDEKESTIIFQD